MKPLRVALLSLLLMRGAWQVALAEEPPAEQDEFKEFADEFYKGGEDTATLKVFDPFQGYNRAMFKVNDKLYFWMIKPVAKGYNSIIPEFARSSFARAFQNLVFPLRFVSSILQFKIKKSGTELGRFVVNSTVGIGGLMDPAGRYLKLYQANEDLGQVLGFYGIGDGFPIVLPVFGQTNLRDGIGMIPSQWFNPVYLFADFQTIVAMRTGERLNFVSLHLGEYESLKKDALDPYTFIRDAYKQRRDQQIKE